VGGEGEGHGESRWPWEGTRRGVGAKVQITGLT